VIEVEVLEGFTVLTDRIDDIEATFAKLTDRQLKQDIHSLKGLAAAYGQAVVAAIAHALENALAQDRRSTPVTAYLDRMREALEAVVQGADPADRQLLVLLLRLIDARSNAA
jgi:HPt (histidine-containing phosphotransfer) domain-containing protein